MAGNLDPIFSKAADIQSGGAIIGPSANTAFDGTGANITSVFQADVTNGGFVQRIRLKAAGSPAATVARIFICSFSASFVAGTSNTAVNTWLWDAVTLPLVTASQVAGSQSNEIPLGFALPAGYRILVSFGTSTGAAGTGWVVTTIAGKY